MLSHKFFQMESEHILKEPKWFLSVDVPEKAILLSDDIIVNNPLFLKGFKTFKVSFNNPDEGLDYHGVTIIPSSSILDFLDNLIKVKGQKVHDLISLCNEVRDNGNYLIHFGI